MNKWQDKRVRSGKIYELKSETRTQQDTWMLKEKVDVGDELYTLIVYLR